jgi:hypothetical protein
MSVPSVLPEWTHLGWTVRLNASRLEDAADAEANPDPDTCPRCDFMADQILDSYQAQRPPLPLESGRDYTRALYSGCSRKECQEQGLTREELAAQNQFAQQHSDTLGLTTSARKSDPRNSPPQADTQSESESSSNNSKSPRVQALESIKINVQSWRVVQRADGAALTRVDQLWNLQLDFILECAAQEQCRATLLELRQLIEMANWMRPPVLADATGSLSPAHEWCDSAAHPYTRPGDKRNASYKPLIGDNYRKDQFSFEADVEPITRALSKAFTHVNIAHGSRPHADAEDEAKLQAGLPPLPPFDSELDKAHLDGNFLTALGRLQVAARGADGTIFPHVCHSLKRTIELLSNPKLVRCGLQQIRLVCEYITLRMHFPHHYEFVDIVQLVRRVSERGDEASPEERALVKEAVLKDMVNREHQQGNRIQKLAQKLANRTLPKLAQRLDAGAILHLYFLNQFGNALSHAGITPQRACYDIFPSLLTPGTAASAEDFDLRKQEAKQLLKQWQLQQPSANTKEEKDALKERTQQKRKELFPTFYLGNVLPSLLPDGPPSIKQLQSRYWGEQVSDTWTTPLITRALNTLAQLLETVCARP